MGESKTLTLERARELSDRLEAARKESQAIRAHLEEWRRRARMFWPEGRWTADPLDPSPDSNGEA
jgi:hypothetical protein